MKTALVVGVLMGMLALAAAGAWTVWNSMGAVEMSDDGVIALVLGVTASLLLGIGLMRLVYISHRRGYDERMDD